MVWEECGPHFFFPFNCFKTTVTCHEQSVPLAFKSEEEPCGKKKFEESVFYSCLARKLKPAFLRHESMQCKHLKAKTLFGSHMKGWLRKPCNLTNHPDKNLHYHKMLLH